MIDQLLKTLVPLMLAKVAEVPVEQKRVFAWYLFKLSRSYLESDDVELERLIMQAPFPPEWHGPLMKALAPERIDPVIP